MMKDKTIQQLTGMVCVEFALQPSDQLMHWVVEACRNASPDPDAEFELFENKSMIAQMRHLLFIYKVYQYVLVKHLQFNGKFDLALAIESQYQYKIGCLMVRLGDNAHSSLK